jgi:hypothetical protein
MNRDRVHAAKLADEGTRQRQSTRHAALGSHAGAFGLEGCEIRFVMSDLNCVRQSDRPGLDS